MGWKSTDPIRFNFEKEGDMLVGYLTGSKSTQFGTKVYELVDGKGTKYYFFGTTDLDRKLPDLFNKIVSIIYKGERKLDGNKSMKVFTVTYWEATNGELPEGFEASTLF
jgi:hypothetical protein